jgi:hypothetical protein
MHFSHQFPEPTTVTLCFFWNGVRDDILARRLSMLRQEEWKGGFERSLSRVKGDRSLKKYLEEARSIRGRGQVVTRARAREIEYSSKFVDC